MSDSLWYAEGASGLPDDFDYTIRSSVFGFDDRYTSDDGTATPLLIWDGSTDDPELEDQHLLISIGKGWEIVDGGASVRRTKGDNKFFGNNSVIYSIIKRCREDFNIGDLLVTRGSPLESKVWVGLVFHMKREEVKYGGNLQNRERLMPTRFVGVVGSGSVNTAPPAVASVPAVSAPNDAVAAARARAAAAQSAAPAQSPREHAKSVLSAAKAKGDDFVTAQTEVLGLDDVLSDPALLDDLMDESGLWATV